MLDFLIFVVADCGPRLPDMHIVIKKYFPYFSTETCLGTQKHHLNETVLLSTPKQMFKLTDKKISPQFNVEMFCLS